MDSLNLQDDGTLVGQGNVALDGGLNLASSGVEPVVLSFGQGLQAPIGNSVMEASTRRIL